MNFIKWLVTSSADPAKYSLALKGALKVGAAYLFQALSITCALHIACLNVDNGLVEQIIETTAAIAYLVLSLWGAGQVLWGLLRKAWLNRWSAYGGAPANLPTS